MELVVPLASRDWSGLICAESPIAGKPELRWTFDSPAPIRVSPVVSGKTVACLCGDPDRGGELCMLDRTSGTVVGRRTVERVSNTLVTDRGSVLLADDTRHLRRIDFAGELVWQAPIGRLDHPVDMRDQIIVGAASTPARLFALDSVTGQVLWESGLRSAPVDSVVMSGRRIVAPTDQGIEVHSLLDGTLQSAVAAWLSSAPVYMDGSRIVGTSAGGEIIVAAGQSGNVQLRFAGARPGFPPLVAGNAVVFAADEFHLLRVTGGTVPFTQLWFDASQLGPMTQPPILRDGSVFLSISGAGLVCLKKSGP
jgi:outer membrane protein assembly factor BamB